MSEKTPARPRQVTWGAVLASAGSLFLLVTVFETLGRLGSVQLREQVGEALADSGVGLGVDRVMELMRYGLMVTAVAGAVAFVAGIFVFQRHHGARIALSVAAVPILLTAPVTGVFMGLLVAMGAAYVWSGPARDWFAGRPVRDQPSARTRAGHEPGPVAGSPQSPPEKASVGTSTPVSTAPGAPPAQPAPHQGYGDAESRPYTDPAAPGGPWSPAAGRVPTQVRAACALTWAGCLVVIVAMASLAVVYLIDPAQLAPTLADVEREVQARGTQVPPGLMSAVVWTMVVMFTAWSVAAIVVAELVRRRHDWARYLLVVSAGASAVVALLASWAGVPTSMTAVLTVWLLFRPEVKAWFAG